VIQHGRGQHNIEPAVDEGELGGVGSFDTGPIASGRQRAPHRVSEAK
jgi:hypothetical protein